MVEDVIRVQIRDRRAGSGEPIVGEMHGFGRRTGVQGHSALRVVLRSRAPRRLDWGFGFLLFVVAPGLQYVPPAERVV